MERRTRTYTISADETQELVVVAVWPDQLGCTVNFKRHPSQVFRTAFVKVDGDERAILSAVLSSDKRRIVVVVEYEPPRPDQMAITLDALLGIPTVVHTDATPTQQEVQEAVQRARAAQCTTGRDETACFSIPPEEVTRLTGSKKRRNNDV